MVSRVRLLVIRPLLAVAMALAVSVPFISVQTASAAPRISVSPSEGRVGDLVVMSGANFVTSVPIKVYFSAGVAPVGGSITQLRGYQLLGETIATGVDITPFSFTIPSQLTSGGPAKSVGPGNYHIYVSYTASQEIQGAADFYVSGPMFATPDSGKIGDYVKVNSAGLKSGDMVNLFFSSEPAAPGAAIDGQVKVYQKLGLYLVEKDGSLGSVGVSFQIPTRLSDGKMVEDVHGGIYYFYATYYNTRTTIATVSRFKVIAGEVTADPALGLVGAEIKLKGSGLRPKEQLSVTFDDKLVLVKSGDSVTDSVGSFSLTITAPESVSGAHTITVTDVTGNCPTCVFQVKPSMTTAATASVGDRIQLLGSGFGEAETITVSVNGTITATDPGILKTNRKGSFSGSMIVPQPTGTTGIKVEDEEKNAAEATVRTLAASTTATMTISPPTSKGVPGFAGQTVEINGARFAQSAAVTVSYGAGGTNVATTKTDAGGNFVTSFKVPVSPAGGQPIVVSDGTNKFTNTFYMEDVPPAPPVPVAPEVVSAVGSTTKFDWSDVDDPSGVTYTFQLASDSSFSGVILDKPNLARSEYTIQDSERLQLRGRQTAYYWRVLSIDGAGNKSAWTVPLLFFVGSAQSALPPWITYALIALGAMLVVVVVIWVRKYMVSRR